MQGDDLSISLFLASLASTFLVGGFGQAGWKHKTFVVSLFLVAAALFGSAFAWPWLKDLSSTFRALASEVSVSPVSWFAIVILGLAAGWARSPAGAAPRLQATGAKPQISVPTGAATALSGKWSGDYHPVTVAGQKFRNERVLLDGHHYTHCDFQNVTFVYNGTTPVRLDHNNISGIFIDSETPAVAGAFGLCVGLQLIRPEVHVELPVGSRIQRVSTPMPDSQSGAPPAPDRM